MSWGGGGGDTLKITIFIHFDSFFLVFLQTVLSCVLMTTVSSMATTYSHFKATRAIGFGMTR